MTTTATRILEGLGSHDIDPLFPDWGVGSEHPTLADVEKLYAQNIEARVAMLKKAIVPERRLFCRVLIMNNSSFRLVKLLATRLPPIVRDPVLRFLGVTSAISLMDRYQGKIERLIEIEDPVLRLDLLIDMNASSTLQDELLVTFARFSYRSDVWRETLNEATKRAKETRDPRHKDFKDRMLAALEKSIEEKELSYFFLPTRTQVYIALGEAGVVTSGYLGYIYWPEVQQGLHSISQMISKLIGIE